VAISGGGYTIFVWARWSGKCIGKATFPNGATVDLAGKSFEGLRYVYRLTIDPTSKKVVLFQGVFDLAEWGRLMGSPEYVQLSAAAPAYPM
jgi:hypothetical protein